MKYTRKEIFIMFSILLAGILAGWFFGYLTYRNSEDISIKKIHPKYVDYKFINPLIGFDVSENQDEFSSLRSLKNILTEASHIWIDSDKADSVSIYFRNMENGQWVGVNEDENYNSASLLKVPFMIAYLKKVEEDKSILTKKIYYVANKSTNENSYSIQTSPLISGSYYSIQDLIRNMIVDSDNFSKKLLVENIDAGYIDGVFSELGFPLLGKENYKISAKNYSLFFRTLYNATFLNRGMSEYALNLLAQAEFKYGLRGGVPANIAIAHKFGDYAEYNSKGDINSFELHDCGIIYYLENPYFLCVMTKGKNLQKLTEVIRDVSGLTYKNVVTITKSK